MSRSILRDLGLALAFACLAASCGTSPPSQPGASSPVDRRFLPSLWIPPTIEVASSDSIARHARAEVNGLLNFSRLLIARTDAPLRRMLVPAWTWESDGCLWIRSESGGFQGTCPHVLKSCDVGDRIEWSDALDGTCATSPPRSYHNAVVLTGWSAPFGGEGHLITCLPGDPSELQEIVNWETLPDSRAIRWRLTDRPSIGPDLKFTLDRLDESEGPDRYEFTFPDSLRWTGEIEPSGASGRVASYRWRGLPRAWVLVDEFTWDPGRGRWKHLASGAEPVERTWGGGVPAPSSRSLHW